MDVDDRGQAHTLEAFSAAIVLLASLVFALQVTAVTPLTASTASQHIENQQAGVAGGVLDQAAQDGTLRETVLYWNDSTGQFHNASEGNSYTVGGPPNAFGERLNETFLDRGIAFNLYITYAFAGNIRTEQMVDLGSPSDNAVTAHRTLVVYDDDHVYEWDGERNASVTVSNATNLYLVSDQAPDSPVYTVVKVELTVWRM